MSKGPVYVTYGRMNPPTVGHIKLIQYMITLAAASNGSVIVYVSHTNDSKTRIRKDVSNVMVKVNKKQTGFTNPLLANNKVQYLNKIFTKNVIKQVTGKNVDVQISSSSSQNPSIYAIMGQLMKAYKHRDVHFVVGSDRLESFNKLSSMGVKLTGIPRSSNASAPSATLARSYAIKGDLEGFLKIMRSVNNNFRPNATDAENLMKKIRAAYVNDEKNA